MSVKLATYSYSFSASSCELHQNVYIGRSRHAEHEYDIRFALGQTVWPLEVIKVSENGVPHSVFVYRPNRFKLHHTTSRDPGQVDTQQKTGFQDVKVKGQGQICEETPNLERGTAQRLRLPAESFQNAPHDVPWPRPGGHSTKNRIRNLRSYTPVG